LKIVSNEEGKEYHMKHRVITFAFAACLVSSLAFADNLTDAPLVSNDGSTTVVHQENQTGNRRHPNKKDESLAAKAKTEHHSKSNRQDEQTNPNYPPTANY
jgi:hypothetical protein